MRLWTLHPQYLDSQGLVALWREALLAQKVLKGETRGYRHHPQLHRFQTHTNTLGCIATYLRAVCDEADRRGYHFDRTKIAVSRIRGQLEETTGQLLYECAPWQKTRASQSSAVAAMAKSKNTATASVIQNR